MHSIQLSYNSQAKRIIFTLELNASSKKCASIWRANIAQIEVENTKNIIAAFFLYEITCLMLMIHWILYLCVQLQQSVPIHEFYFLHLDFGHFKRSK